MPTAISINDLTIGYYNQKKTIPVAGPFNAQINQGELICLMGSNGVGKSTLLKTIAGLIPTIDGEVEINGENLHGIPNAERAKLISIVLTGRPSTGFMTVRDLVILGRHPYTNWQNKLSEDDEQFVNQSLEAVGLQNDADKLVSELSDGNAQKAMIAKTLAQETDIVILDEPLVHLDTRNKNTILALLAKLSRKFNKTVILSSHDLHMIKQIADKIWLVEQDAIAIGTPEDLIRENEITRVLGTENLTLEVSANSQLALRIDGDPEELFLLEAAIRRVGYELKENAGIHINVSPQGFIIDKDGESTKHKSIASLLGHLMELSNE